MVEAVAEESACTMAELGSQDTGKDSRCHMVSTMVVRLCKVQWCCTGQVGILEAPVLGLPILGMSESGIL
jgi:hypothetical protein